MRNAAIILTMFFTALVNETTSSLPHNASADAIIHHDFHYSRLVIDWNHQTQTWQGILRVFTDDIEVALNRMKGTETAWRLGDNREHPSADEALFAYASGHWHLISPHSEAVSWTFIGKEVDYDLTFIYLESARAHPDSLATMESDGLFELFEDQVNEVTIQRGDSSTRFWLTAEDPSKPVQFIDP